MELSHTIARAGTPLTRLAAALAAAALLIASVLAVTVLTTPRAGAQEPTSGLWPTSFRAHETAADCGRWKLDRNGFCVANDARNGLEVGVRFTTSRTIQVTGVRIYRFDTATVTGSLWDSSGTLLARGRFAAGPASAWQDLSFSAPVTIRPGRTYVASYFTPGTKYAFEYQYFAHAGRTVGPVTALLSTPASPNGVHCYDDAACGSFPVRGYRNSTYWVSPLWVDAATAATGARQTAPRVVRVTPRGHATRTGTALRVTFSQPMRSSTLTPSTVRLLRGHQRVATRTTYRAGAHRLVLRPRHALRPRASYRLVVSTRVRDIHGDRLDQDATRPHLQRGTWHFRTR